MGIPRNVQGDYLSLTIALMYGVEAVMPIEFEVPSLRIVINEHFDCSQSLKYRLEWLEALVEACQLASQCVEVIPWR